MRITEKEIIKRLNQLEDKMKVSGGAYVDIITLDGEKSHVLWVDALMDVLSGSDRLEGNTIVSVAGGEMADLITAMMN